MKSRTMKVLAGLSLVLMVFSIIPSFALAEETDTAKELGDMSDQRMKRGPMHEKMADHMMDKDLMEKPEFETEEDEFEFVKEKILEMSEMKIEKLQNDIENIDQIENEEVTEETLNEKIAEIEAFVEDINNASDLDELKEIMEEMRENAPERKRDAGREKPEFETDEEEFEFVKERILNNAEMRIERLQNALGNIDQIENEEVTEETLSERIANAETFIEDISNASDLDELKEIMEEVKENNPRPERDGGRAPQHPEVCEEEATE